MVTDVASADKTKQTNKENPTNNKETNIPNEQGDR